MSLITTIDFLNKSDNKNLFNRGEIDLHEILTDEAYGDNDCWDLQAIYLLDYSNKILDIYNKSSNGFIFKAIWAGDKILTKKEISISELLEIIKNNRISISTEYTVTKMMENIRESNLKEPYIRLLKSSWTLKIVVWLVSFLVSLIVALIFDATIILLIVFFALNYLVFELTTPIADFITSKAEQKRKQPGTWFIADIEREKKHYGPLRANRLFGHPLGRKK